MKQFYLQQIFSTIFYLSNKIQTEGDKLDRDITVRQWMTLLTILHLPEAKANYNQIADMMGYSKQNAKKLVTVLERKGFVTIGKSDSDRRAVCIQVTENCRNILNNYYNRGNVYLNELFKDFDEVEAETLWKLLKKLTTYDGSAWHGYEEKISLE
ncbi:MarR family transcriptional regulator [Clostridium boliviensis]|uniref:MarR family transcriptional regulator n=1 Tax=Clostridium boliviensis TaxID=318465 RepID=A0ABU4GJA8_9CLOT|nr:MarR family transcriptional regulator [Clostridium boliviensis]MDW2797702.1 MarR family transcriptional regulator [Clostridium boliviensis]